MFLYRSVCKPSFTGMWLSVNAEPRCSFSTRLILTFKDIILLVQSSLTPHFIKLTSIHFFVHVFVYPRTDFLNKHYSMGSPFYSAPDDIEMTELLMEQGQAPPTLSLNTDHSPEGSSLLMGED